MHRRISLTRYLVEKQHNDGRIPPELRLLLEVVARACKRISLAVTKGALGEVLGSAESENVQGEVQKKLDIIANEVLIEANEWGGHLAAMASEEMDDIYVVPHRFPKGEYLLLFDPLDGSSNIDVNVSIGTIFSVLRKQNDDPQAVDPVSAAKGEYKHFMQKEIFEQPIAVANTLEMVFSAQSISPNLFGSEAEKIINKTSSRPRATASMAPRPRWY